MATILVVEDDIALSDLICNHLVSEGYTILQVYDGPTALHTIEQHHPDLIILDWMLPGMDGLAVCRRVRQKYITPIIMLTARTEEIDQILGLEVGADDYITKPFSIRQMIARVHALLRRVELESQRPLGIEEGSQSQKNIETQDQNILHHGHLTINLIQHAAYIDNIEIELTPKEYDLLVLLVAHPGWVFKREVILQQIWGDDYEGFDRTIDNHITRLRKKLGSMGDKIDTVWGIGYRFLLG
jgi:DNA-binding response OmpR family regulator